MECMQMLSDTARDVQNVPLSPEVVVNGNPLYNLFPSRDRSK